MIVRFLVSVSLLLVTQQGVSAPRNCVVDQIIPEFATFFTRPFSNGPTIGSRIELDDEADSLSSLDFDNGRSIPINQFGVILERGFDVPTPSPAPGRHYGYYTGTYDSSTSHYIASVVVLPEYARIDIARQEHGIGISVHTATLRCE